MAIKIESRMLRASRIGMNALDSFDFIYLPN